MAEFSDFLAVTQHLHALTRLSNSGAFLVLPPAVSPHPCAHSCKTPSCSSKRTKYSCFVVVVVVLTLSSAAHSSSPYFLNKTLLYSYGQHIILLPPSICRGLVSSVWRQWERQCADLKLRLSQHTSQQSDSLQIFVFLPTHVKNKETGTCRLLPFKLSCEISTMRSVTTSAGSSYLFLSHKPAENRW